MKSGPLVLDTMGGGGLASGIPASPMKIPYFHIDAFADRLFAGNPAGVCVLEEPIADGAMQSIAAENNLSETAFVQRQAGGTFSLRWFTPEVEVDLCGHATLAAAHVMFEHMGHEDEIIIFETRSGKLLVKREGTLLVLDFPSRPAAMCDVPAALRLGLEPAAVLRSRDYLAVFESEDDVLSLKPDMATIRELDALGVIATAPGKTCDFVSRFFAPGAGIPEDPVTGSAHCTLVPYWAERLGRAKLHARQVSRRGGELFCELRGDRVSIGGRAVTYAIGNILQRAS